MKRSVEGKWELTPKEIDEKEKRREMDSRLNKDGRIVLEIDGDSVVVTKSEGRYVWQVGGITHRSAFWPDEKLGTEEGLPTFYALSKEAGRLDPFLPAAEQHRRLKSRSKQS
jgi:hypothetical protein